MASPAGQTNLKRTPLYLWHSTHGGKMVPFAGWEMPVQYVGLREEHDAVRTRAGLFDVSHMGEIRVKGARSLEALQWLTTNDVSKLQAGQAQYSLYPNLDGGIVDDLIVYCLKPQEDYLLCVNASNKDKDFAHMKKFNRETDVTIVDESDHWGQIAFQGPKALEFAQKALGEDFRQLPSFHFSALPWQGTLLYVARTGYTGEEGVEIFVPSEKATALWEAIMAVAPEQIMACGLGARDTLRTEMKYPLYGQEIDDQTNPYSAGLGWVVKPAAKDFLGKGPMLAGKEQGLTQKLVGLQLSDKGIARQGYKIFASDGSEIGRVTSGTLSPTLNQAIAVAYVDQEYGALGQSVWVEIRNRRAEAKVVKTPFVLK